MFHAVSLLIRHTVKYLGTRETASLSRFPLALNKPLGNGRNIHHKFIPASFPFTPPMCAFKLVLFKKKPQKKSFLPKFLKRVQTRQHCFLLRAKKMCSTTAFEASNPDSLIIQIRSIFHRLRRLQEAVVFEFIVVFITCFTSFTGV